ncbi:tail fiber assembly protein (plasmid) [Pantoea agglomerans]|uniref:tail fiber assembly protein n=1 Tax=Enterobacter agglomerans TaxID=549 RepID=UPI00289CFEA0|nr:tail fiber assembly protein [Pantoea agglomerans]WNK51519.1 tail fiber assembly protein [Pantoea agglomerans]
MLTLKNLTSYENEYRDLIVPGAYFLHTEDGLDWYYHLNKFSEETIKVAYDDKGIVRFIEKDASMIWPVNLSVTELNPENVPAEADVSGKWSLVDGVVVPRVYSSRELIDQAEAERDKRIAEARQTMNEWQNDLLLDEISDEDRTSLKKWNAYVKALKAMDLSSTESLIWPAVPSPVSDH